MFILETRNLCKTYRASAASEVRAVVDIALALKAGSFTLLTGPSGSGKTTLLTLLGCLERPTSGQVLFAGRDLARCSDVEMSRLRRRMGFVFQDFALIPGLPVWENVTYHLIPRGVQGGERRQLAAEVLARLGLSDRLLTLPRELSGGEQQRVAIARALAGKPEVLLADEPTSNLDADASGVVGAFLREAHVEGKTILVSSHDPCLSALATHEIVLGSGRVVATRDRP